MQHGSDISVRIYFENGQMDVMPAVSFKPEIMVEIEENEYLGQKFTEFSTMGPTGWTMAIEFEVKGSGWDDYLDMLSSNHLKSIPIKKVDIVEKKYWPDTGQERTYVYPNAVMIPKGDASGMKDKTKFSVEAKSELRTIL